MEDKDINQEIDFDIVEATKIYAQEHEIPHVNGMLVGISGVGKSTLINEFFEFKGDAAARTGVGSAVTMEIKEYSRPGSHFTLFDTRGIEMDNYHETIDLVKDHIEKTNKSISGNNHIHFIWFCVNGLSSKFQEAEIDFINYAKNSLGIIVIIVITQSIKRDHELENYINKKLPDTPIVNVLALEYELKRNDVVIGKIKPYGFKELMSTTLSLATKAIQIALSRVSTIFLQDRYARAEKIIEKTVKAVGDTCHRNIPFMTIDKELGQKTFEMIIKLTHHFDLILSEDILQQIVLSVTSKSTSMYAGRYVAASLIKLASAIGFGLIGYFTIGRVGKAIEHSFARKITRAIGYAYLNAIYDVSSASIEKDEPVRAENISTFFQQYVEETVKNNFSDQKPRTWKDKAEYND